MDEKEKNIDESWKETVAKEKESLKKDNGFAPPEPDFSFFITTLSLQASIALGKIPNPGTNQKENNPEQAKFIIDTLAMLKEKTAGNLKKEEGELLENLLYELRMEYISLSKERLK
ncbi:MAG: DUF1844 domain-containing protein [Candidatus Omnitrophota bacterium]|nr:DUF1844 domain-containing protein [Candidatus Omnitrophota bacterium]MBU1929118.1 DUF1844 domain-containing protein [Candidatus Omnitrophota bacterium]MBU1929131.1 DUF1844 domain-containing protein [Candidatus Omnitrophota bacterium]MBU2035011.1 DUF1844 domain-containing protein [Candidatus Omnitrophota bacterium]